LAAPTSSTDTATLVIAAAAIASAVGTVGYAIVAQRTNRIMHQIYVAVPSIGAEILGIAPAQGLRFIIPFGHFGGNVPATDVVAAYTPYMNGVSQATTRIEDKPHLLMPSVIQKMDGTVGITDYSRIASGEVVFELCYDHLSRFLQ